MIILGEISYFDKKPLYPDPKKIVSEFAPK
jgi:hypothetical protein